MEQRSSMPVGAASGDDLYLWHPAADGSLGGDFVPGAGRKADRFPRAGTTPAFVLALAMRAHGSIDAETASGHRTARGWSRAVLEDTARLALLALAALGLGWTFNGIRGEPLEPVYRSPQQRLQTAVNHLRPPAATAAPSPSSMDLEAFQAFVAARRGVVIDARAKSFYRLGHVPGAINLPRETFATDYAARKAVLDPHEADEIALYCSEEDCPDAELVGEALARLGFRRLRVYRAGWEEWVRLGLPREGGQPP